MTSSPPIPADHELLDSRPLPETFTVTLEVKPADVPAEVRIRQFLKAALRQYGFRCLSVQSESGEETMRLASGRATTPVVSAKAAESGSAGQG